MMKVKKKEKKNTGIEHNNSIQLSRKLQKQKK